MPLLVLGATFGSSRVRAGGYDTPILYSAQHMGLGGAAIAYVDDPSAMFHNPAGLARTFGLTLSLNASLITGSIQSVPDSSLGPQESEPILAVAPLIGASLRPVDWFAFGVAFYPVASAGASYKYDKNGTAITNETDVRFLEIAPSIAFELPEHIRLGVGYRISFASLDRKLTDTLGFDAHLSGTNFTGFRFGAQWDPIPELQIGAVFRTMTATDIKDPSGKVITTQGPVSTTFVLPARLGLGFRLKLEPFRFAFDFEYGFHSQNQRATFAYAGSQALPLVNVFKWHDAITLRGGVEYAFKDTWFFRGGFIYDGQVSEEKYPSAFGTPPAATVTGTLGVGYKHGDDWKMNFAAAYRLGTTKVERNLTTDDEACLPCAFDGDYKLSMLGVYLDFTYSFDDLFGGAGKPKPEPVAPKPDPKPEQPAPEPTPAPAPQPQPAPDSGLLQPN